MFEQVFKNIDDVLRKEAGRTTELDYTEHTQRLASVCERNLATLDELKKSLLHQTFSGQL